ncbi:lipoprotein releasing system, ATP-binding protein [Spiribacter salinus M19-40]|uniref:Lipoprotein releasing system, ATP-binding protein n=1 Tax=Spiribacter salinus M19-40 TaxID=1260251 RepID=R4VF94_9GAMM|nr:ATP-binding cassette domain-containing protein [Spiribacter salinus]AGM40926.1 lipoprotein releasing system, ATP-binding protein [Spiribacter salinus M19-40]MBY5268156.1 lipoprotein ABC transporter ATP-binding protein [Spiribacter salinus]MDR9414298.1 ATP-binding cassette domain-containing protein [Spiribacter sp.]MDR9455021.1 ATP-binding cassette domain-containing protein [Spiribacter sp.]
MSDAQPVIACQGVRKGFNEAGLAVNVLQDLDFRVAQGEQVAILGRSGSGKSTLLQLLGGLEDPDAGTIEVDGVALNGLGAVGRGRLRNRALGFVYQFHHLLGEFSAMENVAMPLLIRGLRASEAQSQAEAMLDQVGLSARWAHKPAELSGGERQRVAIARALVTTPRCLLADEPTGNLDGQTAESILALFQSLNRANGTSVVLVTHDLDVAGRMDRRLNLSDGVLQPL